MWRFLLFVTALAVADAFTATSDSAMNKVSMTFHLSDYAASSWGGFGDAEQAVNADGVLLLSATDILNQEAGIIIEVGLDQTTDVQFDPIGSWAALTADYSADHCHVFFTEVSSSDGVAPGMKCKSNEGTQTVSVKFEPYGLSTSAEVALVIPVVSKRPADDASIMSVSIVQDLTNNVIESHTLVGQGSGVAPTFTALSCDTTCGAAASPVGVTVASVDKDALELDLNIDFWSTFGTGDELVLQLHPLTGWDLDFCHASSATDTFDCEVVNVAGQFGSAVKLELTSATGITGASSITLTLQGAVLTGIADFSVGAFLPGSGLKVSSSVTGDVFFTTPSGAATGSVLALDANRAGVSAPFPGDIYNQVAAAIQTGQELAAGATLTVTYPAGFTCQGAYDVSQAALGGQSAFNDGVVGTAMLENVDYTFSATGQTCTYTFGHRVYGGTQLVFGALVANPSSVLLGNDAANVITVSVNPDPGNASPGDETYDFAFSSQSMFLLPNVAIIDSVSHGVCSPSTMVADERSQFKLFFTLSADVPPGGSLHLSAPAGFDFQLSRVNELEKIHDLEVQFPPVNLRHGGAKMVPGGVMIPLSGGLTAGVSYGLQLLVQNPASAGDGGDSAWHLTVKDSMGSPVAMTQYGLPLVGRTQLGDPEKWSMYQSSLDNVVVTLDPDVGVQSGLPATIPGQTELAYLVVDGFPDVTDVTSLRITAPCGFEFVVGTISSQPELAHGGVFANTHPNEVSWSATYLDATTSVVAVVVMPASTNAACRNSVLVEVGYASPNPADRIGAVQIATPFYGVKYSQYARLYTAAGETPAFTENAVCLDNNFNPSGLDSNRANTFCSQAGNHAACAAFGDGIADSVDHVAHLGLHTSSCLETCAQNPECSGIDYQENTDGATGRCHFNHGACASTGAALTTLSGMNNVARQQCLGEKCPDASGGATLKVESSTVNAVGTTPVNVDGEYSSGQSSVGLCMPSEFTKAGDTDTRMKWDGCRWTISSTSTTRRLGSESVCRDDDAAVRALFEIGDDVKLAPNSLCKKFSGQCNATNPTGLVFARLCARTCSWTDCSENDDDLANTVAGLWKDRGVKTCADLAELYSSTDARSRVVANICPSSVEPVRVEEVTSRRLSLLAPERTSAAPRFLTTTTYEYISGWDFHNIEGLPPTCNTAFAPPDTSAIATDSWCDIQEFQAPVPDATMRRLCRGGKYYCHDTRPRKFCPANNLHVVDYPTELREHQCYTKCTTGDGTNAFCDGNDLMFGPDSDALCLSRDACRDLCESMDACVSFEAHRAKNRCYLNTIECADEALCDDNYDLFVKRTGHHTCFDQHPDHTFPASARLALPVGFPDTCADPGPLAGALCLDHYDCRAACAGLADCAGVQMYSRTDEAEHCYLIEVVAELGIDASGDYDWVPKRDCYPVIDADLNSLYADTHGIYHVYNEATDSFTRTDDDSVSIFWSGCDWMAEGADGLALLSTGAPAPGGRACATWDSPAEIYALSAATTTALYSARCAPRQGMESTFGCKENACFPYARCEVDDEVALARAVSYRSELSSLDAPLDSLTNCGDMLASSLFSPKQISSPSTAVLTVNKPFDPSYDYSHHSVHRKGSTFSLRVVDSGDYASVFATQYDEVTHSILKNKLARSEYSGYQVVSDVISVDQYEAACGSSSHAVTIAVAAPAGVDPSSVLVLSETSFVVTTSSAVVDGDIVVTLENGIPNNAGSLGRILILADIDECAVSNPTPKAICTNTAGSYSISCEVGYALVDNACVPVGACDTDIIVEVSNACSIEGFLRIWDISVADDYICGASVPLTDKFSVQMLSSAWSANKLANFVRDGDSNKEWWSQCHSDCSAGDASIKLQLTPKDASNCGIPALVIQQDPDQAVPLIVSIGRVGGSTPGGWTRPDNTIHYYARAGTSYEWAHEVRQTTVQSCVDLSPGSRSTRWNGVLSSSATLQAAHQCKQLCLDGADTCGAWTFHDADLLDDRQCYLYGETHSASSSLFVQGGLTPNGGLDDWVSGGTGPIVTSVSPAEVEHGEVFDLTVHGHNLPYGAESICLAGEDGCNFQRVRLVTSGAGCSVLDTTSAWLHADSTNGPSSASGTHASWAANSLWTRGAAGAAMDVDVCYCAGASCSSSIHFAVVGSVHVNAASYYTSTFGAQMEPSTELGFSPAIVPRDGNANLMDIRVVPLSYNACVGAVGTSVLPTTFSASAADASSATWNVIAESAGEYAICAGYRHDELLAVTSWYPVATSSGGLGLDVGTAPTPQTPATVTSRVDSDQAWTVAPAQPTNFAITGANLLPTRDRIMFLDEHGTCGVTQPTPLVYPASQAASGYLTDLWDSIPTSCPLEAHGTDGDIGNMQVFIPRGTAPVEASAIAPIDLPRDDYAFDRYNNVWCGNADDNLVPSTGAPLCTDVCAANANAPGCHGWDHLQETSWNWESTAVCASSVKDLFELCVARDDCYGIDIHRHTTRGWLKGINCTHSDKLGQADEYSPWDFWMRPRYQEDTYSYSVNVKYDGIAITTNVGRRLTYSDSATLQFEPIVFSKPGKYKACFCSSATEAELASNSDMSVAPLGACTFLQVQKT